MDPVQTAPDLDQGCLSKRLLMIKRMNEKNVPRKHSAILSTFIKLPFVLKIFVLSIFEWPI